MFRSDRFAALRGFAVLLAVALLFALLAAACDGDGDEGEAPAVGETPAAAETPEAGETPAADDGDDGDGAGGGLQELQALAGQAAGSVIPKVTYRVSTEVNGETTEELEYALVQRPPDYRYEKDFFQEEGGVKMHLISITAGANSYTCPRAPGYEGFCYEAEPVEAEAYTGHLDVFLSMPQELAEAEGVVIVDTSQRSIAGVDATCFKIGSTLPDISVGEVCFSDEGLPLYIHVEGGVRA